MSTQAARSIRLTHTSAQQGFRLLELPRELLGILSSDDAPLYVRFLYFTTVIFIFYFGSEAAVV